MCAKGESKTLPPCVIVHGKQKVKWKRLVTLALIRVGGVRGNRSNLPEANGARGQLPKAGERSHGGTLGKKSLYEGNVLLPAR